MARIIMKSISKTYPEFDVIAVKDFNLEISKNEIIAFLGPSGCGKTTALRMITGLEKISEGELFIDGTNMTNAEPKDRGTAMVFQDFALFPHMTVYENIAFGLKPDVLTESEIKEKVDRIAGMGSIDIVHLYERKPNQLSNGQRQRVALARALMKEHKIILLDEPFSNLDLKLRSTMRTELKKLHQKIGTTFIFVTHDQQEAMSVADRIVIMSDGIIQQIGTPEMLYYSPCNVFTAGFLGNPQMNFWDTVVSNKNGEFYISCGGMQIKLPALKAGKADKYIGNEIIAGIRPENIYVDEASQNKFKTSVIDAKVKTSMFFGRERQLCLSVGEGEFNVCVPPDIDVKADNINKIAFDAEKVYLFDKVTGRTLV